MLQQVTQWAKRVLTRFNDKRKQLNELPRTRAHQYSLSNELTRANAHTRPISKCVEGSLSNELT